MSYLMSPQEYFAKIKDLRAPEEIQQVCEQLTAGLFNDSDKPKTRVNKLTPYNKVVREGFGNHDLVEGQNAYIQTKTDGSLWKRHLHFKYTGLAETKWHGEGGINTKSIVLDRLENRREVKVTQYLETTCKLLNSNDPHELAVGLIAASGRRLVEIVARGSFAIASKIPAYLNPGYFVNFKGQAKKRDYDMPLEERVEYRIGVLVPAEFFLAAFKKFRATPEAKEIIQFLKSETKKGTEPEDINAAIESRRGNSLRRVVAREFAPFLPARFGETEVNNKSLRAVYTRLITDRDCPKNIADILWASRSVGHFIDTETPDDSQLRHLVTTLGYSDYYADASVPFIPAPQKPKTEKAMQVRVTETAFEEIKKIQDDWDLPNQQTTVHALIQLAHKAEALEAQLLEAQAKIAQLENQKEETEMPQAQDLQAMVKQMVAEALAEALPQIQYPISNIQPSTPTPQRQAKPKAEKPETDWESVPSEELKKSKHRGASDEKIRRSFLAITQFNDAQPSNESRWQINNQALRALSGCNGLLVRDWMEAHKGAIDDHNHKYGLTSLQHNRGRGDISEVIKW